MWLQILLLALALVCTRQVWKRWKYDLHKIPAPPELPILGHALDFVLRRTGIRIIWWLKRSLKQLGNPKLMRVSLLGKTWLLVTDLDFIRDVMMSKSSPFPKLGDAETFGLPIIGNDPDCHCATTMTWPSPYVKAVRKVYTAAFQSKHLRTAVPKLQKLLDRLITMIEMKRQQGAVDCQELFVRLTLDAIGEIALETDLGGLDGSGEIYDLILATGYISQEQYFSPLKNLYCSLFPNSKEARQRRSVIGKMTAEWDRLTTDIIGRADPKDGSETFWNGVRNLKDPETGKPIERKTMLAEIGGVVLAGMDTTGHQLGWIFALLATHSHVVDALLRELNEHDLYGENTRALQFEDLGDLTYLTAVVKEGMRIAHVIPGALFRSVPKDMTILGYRVPQGTIITSPGDQLFSTVEEWGDPTVFRPERWLTGEGMSQKYCTPFSVGPRDCAGQRFATLEMKVVIVELVKRYHLTLEGSSYEDLIRHAKLGIVIESSTGIFLHFTPRQDLQ